MDGNSSPESGIIKDPRGDVKVFSKPPKKVIKKRDQIDEEISVEETKNTKSTFSLKKIFMALRIVGCWLPVFFLVLIIIVIVTKPASLWIGVVDFFNADINIPQNSNIDAAKARDEINSQLTSVGQNEIVINESQLAALTKNTFSQLRDLKVDIEQDSIKFIWIVENSIENYPIYGIIQMKVEDNKNLIVSNIGTERIQIPQFLNKTITDSIVSVTKLQGTQNQNMLLYTLLPLDEKVEIVSISTEKDQLRLVVNLQANLF